MLHSMAAMIEYAISMAETLQDLTILMMESLDIIQRLENKNKEDDESQEKKRLEEEQKKKKEQEEEKRRKFEEKKRKLEGKKDEKTKEIPKTEDKEVQKNDENEEETKDPLPTDALRPPTPIPALTDIPNFKVSNTSGRTITTNIKFSTD